MTNSVVVLDYVPDIEGYAETRYIAPRARLHSGVFVTFKPINVIERALLLEVRSKVSEMKYVEVLLSELSKRLKSWTLTMPSIPTDPRSAQVPMPIDLKYIKLLKPILLHRLFDIVIWGSEGGDEPPTGIEPCTSQDEFDARLKEMLDQSAAS